MTQRKYDGRIKEILSVIHEHTGIAIKMSQLSLSYGELFERITKISSFLQKRVEKGSVIAIINKSSWETSACFFAVIDSGCVALLIDANWSPEWIDIVLKDAQPALILSANKDFLTDCVHEPVSGLYASGQLETSLRLSKDASYLIYTSGTSGKPKGAINSIQGLTNLFTAVQQIFSLQPSDTVLQFSSPSFDAWVWEVCLAFSSGASLAIPKVGGRLPGNGLEKFIKQQSVTVATLTPSVLYHCKEDDFVGVHTLITAGERCPKDLAKKWLNGRRLFNAYGPSEAAVCATVYRVVNDEYLPPIGNPIPGVDVWLEDECGQRIKLEGRGEIIISGKSVGLGYLNRPELTAEKFINNPVVFRTGDSANRDSNGVLHYDGRLDRQVKVNGVRIELENVENLLEQNEHVLRAFATVDKEDSIEAKLVAFVLSKPDILHNELRNALIKFSRRNLPAQTSPIIIFVQDLPLRGSGKVDLRFLVAKYLHDTIPNSSGDLCQTICNIFQSCLGMKNISLSDDFFFLGGNSLDMMQCVAEIENKVGSSIPISLAMRNSTPKNMANAIIMYQKHNKVEEDPPIMMKDVPKLKFPPIKKTTRTNGNVFITGTTGLLGAYVVHELLERTADTVMYCLVRAPDDSKALERLKTNLEKHRFWKPSYESRIVCLAGNLGDSNFGLSKKIYSTVKENIGFVYHIASNVNWVFSYSALESANVDGTKHAILLCCDSGAKLVYVSSIGVHFSSDWHSTAQFKESAIPQVGDQLLGYLRSKWVSEQLIHSAIEHGVLSYVFRPPFICGGSDSTELLSRNDFLLNKIQACIELGCMPFQGFFLDIYPADLLASGIVSVSLQERYANQVFQFTNPKKLAWHEISAILKQHGHRLRVVDYKEWIDKVVSKPNPLTPHLAYIKPAISNTRSIYEHHHGDWPKVVDVNVSSAIKDREQPPSVADLIVQYLPKQNQIKNKII